MIFNKKKINFILFFLNCYIFKKKKLGFKKLQWNLYSYFHLNRVKYFLFFIRKFVLYKKYFFCFFIKKQINLFFSFIKSIYSNLLINKHFIFNENHNTFFINKSNNIKSNFLFIKSNSGISLNNLSYLNLYYYNLFLKLWYFSLVSSDINYSMIPITRKRYTILRSPHVDKKSREQFELKTFKLIINNLNVFNFIYNPFLFKYFKYFLINFKLEEKLKLYNYQLNS